MDRFRATASIYPVSLQYELKKARTDLHDAQLSSGARTYGLCLNVRRKTRTMVFHKSIVA